MSFIEPNMESLPEEMIEQISKYLQASDLASCCAVSRSWREVFGGDRLWRVHCDKTLPQYLDVNSCKVEPHFSSPEPEDTTLSAIGEWRLNFMKETRLKNNWSSGNFNTEKKSFIQRPRSENEPALFRPLFFQDRYILMFQRSELEVWDLNKTPAYKSSFPFNMYPSCGEFEMILFKVFDVKDSDKFVVSNNSLMRVYSLSMETKKLELVHVFSIEMPEKCCDSTEEAAQRLFKTEQDTVDKRSIGRYVKCSVVGSVLVGLPRFVSPPRLLGLPNKFHIWNVETGQKLKEEDFPIKGCNYRWDPIPACEKTKDIVIEGEMLVDGKLVIHWNVYSLNKQMFLPFHNTQTLLDDSSDYDSIIFDKYVALRVGRTLSVYNYLTNEMMYTTPCEEECRVLSFRNCVVFHLNNMVHIINPVNQNLMETVNVDDSQDTYVEAVGTLGIILKNLGSGNEYTNRHTIKFKDTRVPVCEVTCVCLISQTGTKIVFIDFLLSELIVVHFW